MKKNKGITRRTFIQWTSVISASAILPISGSLCAQTKTKLANNTTFDLRILGTTDLHGNMMDFDYYTDKPTNRFGFTRTAGLINDLRAQKTNTVLVDNGDLLQGAPLTSYVASKGLAKGDVHPIFQAMNSLGYSAATLGNHEFNYGLEFLNNALSGADFPYVLANAFDAKTDKPYFKQYVIVDTPVVTNDGKKTIVKIGYVGFVTPQIMIWDKKYLNGKIITKDIIETAKNVIPNMRAEGADIVIAMAHTGISSEPQTNLIENSTYYLSQVPGIDAIVFGHQHMVFPSSDYVNVPGVDIENGTINGIPAVMAGAWGNHVGIIDLTLRVQDSKWQVTNAKAQAHPIYDGKTKSELAKADEKIAAIFAPYHQASRDMVGMEIGQTSDDINSYLSLIQNTTAMQLVNDAQRAYVENYVATQPALKDLPILSSIAPYKVGNRKTDPENYVDIKRGKLSFRNAVDLYPFGNTLSIVKSTGKEIGEWLECCASMFNQIDVNNAEAQDLINFKDFQTFNFDIFDGIEYEIDVTQPARYNAKYQLVNENARRVKNIRFGGKPIDEKAEFLIASNSHRAHAGQFPGTGDDKTVYASTDENRVIIAEYITAQTAAKGSVSVNAKQNWRLALIESAKPLDIRVYASGNAGVQDIVTKSSIYPMNRLGKDDVGFDIYQIDLKTK